MREAEVPGHASSRRTRRSTCCRGTQADGGGGRGGPGAGSRPAAAKGSAASAACGSSPGAGRAHGRRAQLFSAEELHAGWRLACQTRGRRPDGGRGPAGVAGRRGAPDPRRTRRRAVRRPTEVDPAGPQALRRVAPAGPRRRRPRPGAAGKGRRPAGSRSGPAAGAARPLRARPVSRHGRVWPTAGCSTSSRAIPTAEAFAVAVDLGTTTLAAALWTWPRAAAGRSPPG